MRLVRLYSNKPDIFEPIEFNKGLSAVYAEIRVPENRDLNTHNLGKSTVGQVIDFCLLKGVDKGVFLIKHKRLFTGFTFYLEMELPGEGAGFLTIGRSVETASKIDFKKSNASIPDAADLGERDWDHLDVPIERARLLLDGMLGFDALKPWPFRKLVGYLVRTQQDYLEVFQLKKFSGKHKDWKPFVGHLIGMEADPMIKLYETKDALEKASTDLKTLASEWGDAVEPSVIDGLISVKSRDVEVKRAAFDSFNFRAEDSRVTAEVVEETEAQIVALNDERYRLAQVIRQIENSLASETVAFKPRDAEALFKDAGVVFGDQLKRDFDQLIAFNRAVTSERREELAKQMADARARIAEVDTKLKELNAKRSASLEFLRQSDALAKYKELTSELTAAQAELSTLEAKREAAARLVELRRRERALKEEFSKLQTEVEEDIETISGDEDGRFGRLRRYFSEIINEVLGEDAIIAIRLNDSGGVDFTAEFVDGTGTATSADRGTSYRKLMCIAFDLAVLRTYDDVPFPRFVYHDGALEQLEQRKQAKLLGVFRSYAELGLQPIFSLLDKDLPTEFATEETTLSDTDIVLRLHDEGESGRLFKMPSW